MRQPIWVALAGAALCLFSAGRLQAQACCGANNTTDFGVVAPQAQATFASALSYRQGFGNFDPAGNFNGARGLVDRDLVLRLGGGVRLWYDRLQVYGSAPLRLQHRDLNEVSKTAVGVGDVAGALRWTALKPEVDGIQLDNPESFIPLWDLFVGATLPTGAEPGFDRDLSQADVFGNGAFTLSLGTKVIKTLTTRHLVAVRGQYDYRFPTERKVGENSMVDFQPGQQVSLRVQYLYTHSIFLTAGVFAGARFAAQAEQDTRAVPDSQEHLINFGGQVTYAFDYPNWDITFGLNSDAFWDGGGANVPFAAVSAIVILRRTFMGEDDHSGHHHGDGHDHGGHHHQH